MVDCLLCIALGVLYSTENSMALAELELILREAHCTRGLFFRPVEFFVFLQQQSEDDQTVRLLSCSAKPPINI